MSDEIENLHLKQLQFLLKDEIYNWVRWGRMHVGAPRKIKCVLGDYYQARVGDVFDGEESSPLEARLAPIAIQRAEELNDRINRLAARPKQAFVMYYLDRVAIAGKVIHVAKKAERAKLLGVGERQYQNILREALKTLARTIVSPTTRKY